jgi:L-methionine (R)-S-oxide reductase
LNEVILLRKIKLQLISFKYTAIVKYISKGLLNSRKFLYYSIPQSRFNSEKLKNYLCRMSEDLAIIKGSKAEQYKSLIPQIKGLLEGENDRVANMANTVAALKEQFGWLWVGFYVVKNDELVLAPFQGPVACTRIKKGRGVCGTSWAQAKTLLVPDVEKFPGHIACSSASKSEIVVPVIRNGEVMAVLDADSADYDHFDNTDQQFLEEIVSLIEF